jgi:DNA-binding LacI/PurR family transcriptional regulator
VNSPDNQERLAGYTLALEQAGVSVPPEKLISGHFQFEDGWKAFEQLFELSALPTALLAANDEMAMGAIAAAQLRGMRVPQDLAVIGFDDIQVAGMIHPSLTTVQQPMQQLGETAVKQLFHRLQAQDAPWCHEVLPTRLVVRQSCGCQADETARRSSR